MSKSKTDQSKLFFNLKILIMMNKFTFKRLMLFFALVLFTNFTQAQNFTNEIPIPYLMPGPDFDIDITSATHNFDPNGALTDINLNVQLPTAFRAHKLIILPPRNVI